MTEEAIQKVWNEHNAAMKEISNYYLPIIEAIDAKYAKKLKDLQRECAPLWSKLGYASAEAEVKRRTDGLNIMKWEETSIPDYNWRSEIAALRENTDNIIAKMKNL